MKNGFCWPGLLLPLIWPLYHRLWLLAGLVLGVCFVLGGVFHYGAISETVLVMVAVAVNLIFGFEANGLREHWLERRGFKFISIVSGQSYESCEIKFFMDWAADGPVESPGHGPMVADPRAADPRAADRPALAAASHSFLAAGRALARKTRRGVRGALIPPGDAGS